VLRTDLNCARTTDDEIKHQIERKARHGAHGMALLELCDLLLRPSVKAFALVPQQFHFRSDVPADVSTALLLRRASTVRLRPPN